MMNISQRQLEQRLERLARRIEPPDELWPGIAARLTPRALQRRPWPLWATAAAMIVGAVSLVWLWLPQQQTDPGQLTGASVASLYAQALDLEYRAATVMLDQASAANDDGDDLALAAALQEVDDATAAIRRALRADPDSIFLVDLLASAHRKRLSMLRQQMSGGQYRRQPLGGEV